MIINKLDSLSVTQDSTFNTIGEFALANTGAFVFVEGIKVYIKPGTPATVESIHGETGYFAAMTFSTNFEVIYFVYNPIIPDHVQTYYVGRIKLFETSLIPNDEEGWLPCEHFMVKFD